MKTNKTPVASAAGVFLWGEQGSTVNLPLQIIKLIIEFTKRLMNEFTAITPQQYANKAWQRYSSYAFVAKCNVIPVVAAELAHLVAALPLGFVQTGASFQLMAITSLRPGTNLFVAPNGDWLGRYIPAAVRGYPFGVVKMQDQKSILCINESSGMVVQAELGEAFYDETGSLTHALKDMRDFLISVEADRVVTQAAVDALQAANLIQRWPLHTLDGSRNVVVEGLYRVDETMLNAMSEDVFLSLRKAGGLPLAYAQLLSMSHLPMLQTADNGQKCPPADTVKAPAELDRLVGLSFLESDTLKFS